MGVGEWLSQNWFYILSTVIGFGGLWFAAFSIRKAAQAQEEEAKARRISNLLAITANHRELWKECFHNSKLARVIDPAANVAKQPITSAEEIFMSMAISHTSSTYEALKDELVTKQDGFRRDVKSFFSLPVPRAVWIKTKLLQNQDFAAFIEFSLK
jgi:hypothetical protein